MRHRMGCAGMTGLGNPDPTILNNKWDGDKEREVKVRKMFSDAMETFSFFKKMEGADFGISKDEIKFGIEPTYQYEYLDIISIRRIKKASHRIQGRAWGDYGSGIAKRYKFYSDYKVKSKFVRFIDKWHKELFGEVKGK